MVNVYDLAHELVRSLKETDQYKDYQDAKAAVSEHPELIKMLNDFSEMNMKLQEKAVYGNEPDAMQQEQLAKMYSIIMSDPLTADYLQKQIAFTKIFAEVYGIICEAVDG